MSTLSAMGGVREHGLRCHFTRSSGEGWGWILVVKKLHILDITDGGPIALLVCSLDGPTRKGQGLNGGSNLS